jgi:predicted rRNA methylase YqxC with S4 and FtsJ domains
MKTKHITEARDNGGYGMLLNRFLVEFGLAKNISHANDLIRMGAVDLDNHKIKDVLHLVEKGTWNVKIHGDYVAEATLL